MSTKLIIFVLGIIQFTYAIPGFSTAGVDFVFSCPQGSNETEFQVMLRVTSERYISVFDLRTPLDEVERYNLKEYHYASIKLDKGCKIPRGLYPLFRLNSSSPVRACLQVYTEPIEYITSVRLIPKQSCYRTYFISAFIGDVFMKVHTFYSTRIMIRFSNAGTDFKFSCWGDQNYICESNKVLNAWIEENNVMNFYLNGSDYDLQSTMIHTDKPVFVTAGNVIIHDGEAKDAVTTTMQPYAAWGKQYIVPKFFDNSASVKLILRFNARTFPFSFQFTGASTKNVSLSTAVRAEYLVEDVTQSYFISSKTPFGLYAFILLKYPNLRTDAVFLNVIPVEQWMNGFHRIATDNDYVQSTTIQFFILTTANPNNVVIPEMESEPQWTNITSVGNTTFYLSEISIKKQTWYVFLHNATGKLMIYVKYRNKDTATVFPYDFYIGEINNPNCTKVISIPSDGVDNDCDGVIDEEIKDNEDDDGDGEVDEDVVEPYQDGIWSPWRTACEVTCNDETKQEFIRSCDEVQPSRFGADCEGPTSICDKEEACPTDCSEGDPIRTCTCAPSCSECKSDSATCEMCVPGYYQTPYCLTKCPTGWEGPGCNRGPRTVEEFAAFKIVNGEVVRKDDGKDTSAVSSEISKVQWALIFMPAVLLVVAAATSLCLVQTKRRRAQRTEPKGQEEVQTAASAGGNESQKPPDPDGPEILSDSPWVGSSKEEDGHPSQNYEEEKAEEKDYDGDDDNASSE